MRLRALIEKEEIPVDLKGNWKLLQELPDSAWVILYHATSLENAQNITKIGWDAHGRSTWKRTSPYHVYLGGLGGLGTYLGHKGGEHNGAYVIFKVRKGDLEPDRGSDWKSHRRLFVKDIVRHHGREALKQPSAAVTYAAINQVRVPAEKAIPIGILDGHGQPITESSQISDLIHQFAQSPTGKRCLDHRAVFDTCKATTKEFAEFLSQHGVASRIVQVHGAKLDYPEAHKKWKSMNPEHWIHYLVLIGDKSIDWTQRQYSPQAAVPEILDKSELPQRWEKLNIYKDEKAEA
jgi:hypothetical protein